MSRGTSVKPSTKCTTDGCPHTAVAGSDKCQFHLGHNQKRFRSAMYNFKSREVQTAFELMLQADDRFSLDNELALMRTCLQAAVAKCDAEKLTDMGPHSIAAITSLASEVARTCDVMARLESKFSTHVPMEVLLFFVQLIAETLMKHVGEDQAEACVSAILELPLPQQVGGATNKVLARGSFDPRYPEMGSLRDKYADRQSKIEELRAQARALREEIRQAGGDVDARDEDLAPAEPTEETSE